MQTTLEYANFYISRGYSVIPLVGKIPDASVLPKEPNGDGELKATWKPYQTRIPTRAEIDKWFSSGNRNIGIVTGSISGIVVVDLDSREAAKLAKDLELPATPLVKTGRGYHAYYGYREGVRNFQKRDDLPGIDLRGDGGYVVAPPSIHASGAQYTWVNGRGLNDLPMAEFPEIILVGKGNTKEKTPIAELYKGATEGSRNDTLARITGSWARDGLSLEDCLEMAYAWNVRNNPPLPEREVEQTVRSIYDKHKRSVVDIVDLRSGDENEADVINEITESALPVVAFPIEVFQQRFRQTVEKLSTSFNVDIDVCASIALSVISSATGNTIRISPKSGWEVSPFVWMGVIADSGYGKTHPIDCLIKPIDRLQARAYMAFKSQLADYNDQLQVCRKNKDASLPTKPVLEQYKAADHTVESLADIFEVQGRGVLIHQDELSGLVSGMNQYKGGGGNDRQHFLQLFNCNPWKLDRKSGSRYIHNTGAAIIGGLQPQIMPKVFGHDSFDDGLLPRFLFVTASSKTQRFNRTSITQDDLSYWHDLIEYCFEIPLKTDMEGFVEPKLLILSGDALDIFESFYNEYHEKRAFLPSRVKVFIPKLITYCLKLAAILHVMKQFGAPLTGGVVSSDTISDAIMLTRFYTGQVATMVKRYSKPVVENSQYEDVVIQALANLRGEVKKSKLPLSRIAEEVNSILPEGFQMKGCRAIGSILKRLNLQTQKSTGGVYFLLWDSLKMEKLLETYVQTSTCPLNCLNLGGGGDEKRDKKWTSGQVDVGFSETLKKEATEIVDLVDEGEETEYDGLSYEDAENILKTKNSQPEGGNHYAGVHEGSANSGILEGEI